MRATFFALATKVHVATLNLHVTPHSTIYDRLRREEREEPKRTCISPLAFVQLLPHTFTTAVANKLGEEMGIKERAVRHHLRTLCVKGYIERLRQGVYRKVTRRINSNNRQAA